MLRGLVNFRDKRLAHSLGATYREALGETIPAPRHGDERALLRSSVGIVHGLHLGINNGDFDFVGSRRIARRNAEALWYGCAFQAASAQFQAVVRRCRRCCFTATLSCKNPIKLSSLASNSARLSRPRKSS